MAYDLSTPEHCIADLCLVPIGTGSASVSKEVAIVTELFRDAEKDGRVKCTLHSAGTTIGECASFPFLMRRRLSHEPSYILAKSLHWLGLASKFGHSVGVSAGDVVFQTP